MKSLLALVLVASLYIPQDTPAGEDYLLWSESHAVSVGKKMLAQGRVGGFWDGRIIHTEHAYNYKLRATWLTPEVIRASARLAQIREYLSVEETQALVTEAETAGDTVILVEVDPREGSGVIPRDWLAILSTKDSPQGEGGVAVRGLNTPGLRKAKALAGVMKRDYAYDIFWVVFPLVDSAGNPAFDDSAREAELIVRISGKEGRVRWAIPESIRERARTASLKATTPEGKAGK